MDIMAEGVPPGRPSPGSRTAASTSRGRSGLMIAEQVANGIMDAEADQLCAETGNSRNGYRCAGSRPVWAT